MTTAPVSQPLIAAKLAKAGEKRYRHGVLGLRAAPQWDSGSFAHDGVRVTVAACPSTLAVWEALENRSDGEWLVILTPLEEDELGSGVLAHLVDGRLLTPDPWDALRSNFAAATIEPALYRVDNDRALATGLLAVLSSSAYTPARGGVLTRAHAMSAVARSALAMTDDPAIEIDTLTVLEWSRHSGVAAQVTELARVGGPGLFAAFTEWLGERSGRLGRVVSSLLRSGRIADLVPLGLIAGLLEPQQSGSELARGLFLGRFELGAPSLDDLRGWYQDSASLLTRSLTTREIHVVLADAERHVHALGIDELAGGSEFLPRGLQARLGALSEAIDAMLPAALGDPDVAISGVGLASMEAAWLRVQQHYLAKTDAACAAFAAGVRLVRWLASAAPVSSDLADLTDRYVAEDSWVDTALSAARRGAELPGSIATLRTVIDLVSQRRRRHDRQFAGALAAASQPAVPGVEEILRRVVLPLAESRPTLLLVLDGLSMAVTNELFSGTTELSWTEASVPGLVGSGTPRRAGALAVLPTLTRRSRCSLLCGDLREGDEQAERAGFAAVLRASGLQAPDGRADPIFHKKALDSVPAGAALATEVNDAIGDTEGRRLVAAVLNYVDDTLHHTDPGRATWTVDTIPHLRPLLQAAHRAGRAVIVTSDHGHVIERRESVRLDRANLYGQRAHADTGRVDDSEILVEGPRVLTDTSAAVLAVDDTVRYGVVNAGYHGGGSPAEVVVPVIALYTGQCPESLDSGDVAVEPQWWNAALPITQEPVPVRVAPAGQRKSVPSEPSLFDEPVAATPKLSESILATAIFVEQLRLAGRVVVRPEQISALIDALAAAGSRELPLAKAATVVQVPPARIKGALLQIKRVLDVEGYEVLLLDDGAVRLDEAALREQFGVSR
ncbi:BREX-2 system phosphatase PglZ [Nocardia sp. BMG111209]|uniref:BREX-2 system phosphatase PglZ n=1 Tax=Nocardia sp. BMG111209 TaxID=1160137 RepID=UPI00036FEB99|nr:BREX-2 system phosphatase PglZ [Nocardia sp. BMG111209]